MIHAPAHYPPPTQAIGATAGTSPVAPGAGLALSASLIAGITGEQAVPSIGAPPVILTTSVAQATAGSAYSATLQAQSALPVTWAHTGGSLPTGLTFTDNGDGTATIAGTPTTPGVFGTLTFTATNAAGPAQVQFSMTVALGLDGWLATANAHYDPHDATKRAMSGDVLVSLTSKGTAGALLAKVVAGDAEIVTLPNGREAARLTLARLKVRNAGDTADVPIGSLIAAGAGCVLVVARFPGGTNRGLFADATAGQNVFTTGAPNMQYWCGSYFNASGPGLANDTLAILGFHHDGTNIWVSVNGVAGTPTPTSAPLSNVSVAAYLAGSDSGTTTTVDMGDCAIWPVATPSNFAAGIALLKTRYGIA